MTKTAPLFSVIMNCRNSATYLREAIDSVFAQTISDWEIIFLDNASTDQSPEIVKSYSDERIKYRRNESAVSLGEARNLALQHVSGKYVSFLDCDDIWLSTLLEEQKKKFDSSPDICFVHANYYTLHEPQKNLRLVNAPGRELSTDELASQLSHYRIGMVTVSFRSSLLKNDLEWFDPTLTLAEDVDLFLRILAKGRGAYMDQPLAHYRIHAHNLSHQLKSGWANELDICLKKILSLVPELESRCPQSLLDFRAKIAYLRARDFLAAGENRRARKTLAPYRFHSLSLSIFYGLTLLPFAVWNTVYKIYYYLKYKTKPSSL